MPVTANGQPISAIAKRAIEILLERISSRGESSRAAPIEARFEAQLVVREYNQWRQARSRAPNEITVA